MMELNPKAQAIAIHFTNPANLETCNLNIIWMAPTYMWYQASSMK
jgi:hypothetical protein